MARSHRPPAERACPGRAGLSRPSPRRPEAPRGHADRSSVDASPRAQGVAGVGTFPGWLSLAVAPASKGLIPQPVSMSNQEFRMPPRDTQALQAPRRARGVRIHTKPPANCGGGAGAASCDNVLTRYYRKMPMKTHQHVTPRQEALAERNLCAALAALRTPEECRAFLRDLCTPAELQAMADRWTVVDCLKCELPYREIQRLTGVSVTTIGRVARFLAAGHGGHDTTARRLAETRGVHGASARAEPARHG